MAFIEHELPDYLRLESWVVANARDLRPQTIAALDERIRSGRLPPERAALGRARFGIADDEFASAVALNDLDDWAALHEEVVSRRVDYGT